MMPFRMASFKLSLESEFCRLGLLGRRAKNWKDSRMGDMTGEVTDDDGDMGRESTADDDEAEEVVD